MQNQNKELNISDLTCCHFCSSKQKRTGNSLHCWTVEYVCGCVVWGSISDDGIYLDVECGNNINKK